VNVRPDRRKRDGLPGEAALDTARRSSLLPAHRFFRRGEPNAEGWSDLVAKGAASGVVLPRTVALTRPGRAALETYTSALRDLIGAL